MQPEIPSQPGDDAILAQMREDLLAVGPVATPEGGEADPVAPMDYETHKRVAAAILDIGLELGASAEESRRTQLARAVIDKMLEQHDARYPDYAARKSNCSRPMRFKNKVINLWEAREAVSTTKG